MSKSSQIDALKRSFKLAVEILVWQRSLGHPLAKIRPETIHSQIRREHKQLSEALTEFGVLSELRKCRRTDDTRATFWGVSGASALDVIAEFCCEVRDGKLWSASKGGICSNDLVFRERDRLLKQLDIETQETGCGDGEE